MTGCVESWTCFWTALTAMSTAALAILTIIIAWIACVQLNKMSNISKADFAHRCKNDFFTSETRNLFMLFEHDLIEFKFKKLNEDCEGEKAEYLNYFELIKGKKRFVKEDSKQAVNFIHQMLNVKEDEDNKSSYFSSNEIDDLLLGHFEDLQVFYLKGIIDNDFIYNGYSYYIQTIGDNEQIKAYIKHLKNTEENGSDFYKKFDELYKRLNPKKKGLLE
jgi:hypothetical protein